MSARTRTPRPPKQSLLMMLKGLLRVPRSVQMCMCLESQLRLNLLSSVKSTRPHSLSLQFRCSRHHRERLLRWAGITGAKLTHLLVPVMLLQNPVALQSRRPF
ncbi:hypothetical protein X975_20054, partial [Stegodyphus mimosarum]